MRHHITEGAGFERLILGGATLAAVVLCSIGLFSHDPPARHPVQTRSPYQLCAGDEDSRQDDWSQDDWGQGGIWLDDDWTQEERRQDAWRIDRLWRRVDGPEQRPKIASIPMTMKIFDPRQRWLRIPGVRDSRLRQAESSGVDIFRYRDSIFAFSGERWYRSERGTGAFHPVDSSELPSEILAVPVWVWRHYPREWAERPENPLGTLGQDRRGSS